MPIDEVVKSAKIDDSEWRVFLFKKVCDMILDDKSFDECRDVHNKELYTMTCRNSVFQMILNLKIRRSHLMLWEKDYSVR